MAKMPTRATFSAASLSGAALKAALTAVWDALSTAGLTDSTRATVTATSTLVTTQCGLLLVDATSASIVLTLPTSGVSTDDALFVIRRIDTSANTLTVQRGSTDTIDGAVSITIPVGGIVDLQMPAGGTVWRMVGNSAASPFAQTFQAFTSAGTAPAYTLTPAPALTALTANQRFRVKVHSATTGACTLAVSGLTATAVKQYDATGAKVDPVLAVNQLVDMEYDGTNWVVLDPLPSTPRQIQPVTASVAASALTATLNPTVLDFRSSTLGSGSVVTRTVAAAISVVVPSTATLGTISAQASRIMLLAIDNAGTVELAVVNVSGGVNLDETTLISTTAISAAATAANVVYSTTARTGVAFRVVGIVDSTQATAGTWATAPSTIQGMGGNALSGLMGLGHGQAWQSVTRTAGTNYYNTTGKPIQIVVFGTQATSNAYVQFTVNGTTVLSGPTVASGVPGGSGGGFTIPPGAQYSWSVSTGSLASPSVYELR